MHYIMIASVPYHDQQLVIINIISTVLSQSRTYRNILNITIKKS